MEYALITSLSFERAGARPLPVRLSGYDRQQLEEIWKVLLQDGQPPNMLSPSDNPVRMENITDQVQS